MTLISSSPDRSLTCKILGAEIFVPSGMTPARAASNQNSPLYSKHIKVSES